MDKKVELIQEHFQRSENWILGKLTKHIGYGIGAVAIATAFFFCLTTDRCKVHIGDADSMTIGTATAADPDDLPTENVEAFIAKYAATAVQEDSLFGIPASITMAQAILESAAGRSKLAMQSKNYFGIKCFAKNCPKGHCIVFHDDKPDDRFLVFTSEWISFREHSKFLKKDNYKPLFKNRSYESWADGLLKQGYATDKGYSNKVKKCIVTYNLVRFDKK